ncbi:ascorbate peroxidase [Klebsormidium nitens]|uniref:L-ascorbate peroxidase n=1 Tax=Klebsormidium nitens TaxID=105231 RepID=A0A1Y1I328_KLENI|nr:ascorbate peroxidase [Klebsormidium nitens]|eukprot:GAQ83146.1 ascorbate peroxidase [Klebsormidium nitens]
MAISSKSRRYPSPFPRALVTLFFAFLLFARAASRVLPEDSTGDQTWNQTTVNQAGNNQTGNQTRINQIGSDQTGNQTAASSRRRLLQSNNWSQPSSGPVDVNRAYKVLAKYVTVDIAGILLRMAFHDAGTYDKSSGTGGANGSLKYELSRALNEPISSHWSVIESIKGGLPNVSYADVIFLAGFYAIHITGGPLVTSVRTGRVDASVADPDNRLPLSSWNADQLTSHFGDAYGFGCQELVALSGAHSIGTSKVTPPLGPMDDTSRVFDVRYYQKLVNGGGSFPSDKALSQSSDTSPYVRTYAGDQDAWWAEFVDALKKIGDLGATYES